MRRNLIASVIAVVVITAFFGFGYPALMTGFAQLAFPNKADGSLIKVNGQVVGSRLAAQEFKKQKYFHERLSAVGYNAAGTSFANYGPTSPNLKKQVDDQIKTILKLEGPYHPGMTVHDIPVDAVTTSASGIDPDISLAYAHLQAARVASVRGLSLDRVNQLIDENKDGRFIGFFGEPGVNVLELNISLDKETK
jgi:K+-transporting ATPase ATPase C chain